MRTRYRAVVGGLAETMLVFVVAGVATIGVYGIFRHTMYRSQATNTATHIRGTMIDLSKEQSKSMHGNNIKEKTMAHVFDCRWQFDEHTNTLSITFTQNADAAAVLSAMPELIELNTTTGSTQPKIKDGVLVVKKWDAA